MDRRKFIKSSILGTASLVLAPDYFGQDVRAGVIVPGSVYSDGKAGEVSTDVEKHLKVDSYVREPSHKIPVVGSYDVVVVGGGAAGVAAAVCAAREGSNVILIEKTNYLGGYGLVVWFYLFWPLMAKARTNPGTKPSKVFALKSATLCYTTVGQKMH